MTVAKLGRCAATANLLTAITTIALAMGAPAQADPQPAPTPPPDAPKCLTYGGQPWPHPRLLPCGWDWDGTHWTRTAATTQGGDFLPAHLNTIRGNGPGPDTACQPQPLAPCDTP